MDVNQSSISSYSPDNRGITGTSKDTKAVSESPRIKDNTIDQQRSQLSSLKEGQVIRGQVIDHRYNEMTIQLKPSDQTITARLSGNIPLSIGQEAVFQVTGNTTDSLMLKYLPQDLSAATDLMIQKALSASGFGATEKNRQIVQELLNHNMPIDKQTLQTLIKYSYKNPTATPLTLVLMYKNNIPMTPENIRQFEAYQNGTNRLLNNIRTISSGISSLITQSDGNNPKTEQINTTNPRNPAVQSTDSLASGRNAVTVNQTDGSPIQSSIMESVRDEFLSPEAVPLNESSSDDNITGQLTKLLQLNDKLMNLLTTNPADLSDNLSAQINNSAALADSASLASSSTIANYLNPGELTALLSAMKDFNIPNQLKGQIKDGTASINRILELIRESLETLDENSAAKFLASPEYSKLLENALLQRWTISPDKLSENDPVSELYRNLKGDMDKINHLVKDISGNTQAEQMKEPIKDTQQNLQFMKDLNETFTYIQLPVQIKDRQLHSELYVLNNKKALQDTPDNISVLLHLDMEHLGPMNVNLTLNGNSIRANFHMSGDEAVQLVETNLPLLTEALTKKGYTLNGSVANDYEKPDFSRDFIEEGSGDGEIRSYSFDIRT